MKEATTLDELRAENDALRLRIEALEAEKNERVQADAQASARFARLRRVLAELPLIVDIFDIAARRSVFKNRELDLMLGYPLGALAAMGPQPVLYKIVHPEDVPRLVSWIDRMLDPKTATNGVIVEYRVRRGDGAETWFRSQLDAFERDAEGRTLTGLMVTYDVTETKVAEAALRALNAELDGLVVARTAKLAETNEALREEIMLRTEIAAEAEAAARLIRVLGSPVLRVQDDVLAVPIIGTLDTERAEIMTDALLAAISTTGARFAILDLTGVGEMDAATTEHIQRLIRAISLLGAEVVICGIGSTVARIMIEKGLMTEGVTVKNLREALRYCVRRRRL